MNMPPTVTLAMGGCFIPKQSKKQKGTERFETERGSQGAGPSFGKKKDHCEKMKTVANTTYGADIS